MLRVAPLRRTVSVTWSPGFFAEISASRAFAVLTEVPSSAVITSPERSPARDAGSDLDAARARERERMQLRGRRVDVDDGEVGRGVAADDRRVVALAVGERDPDRARAVDDMFVRDDVALRVVDEAGALRLRL